MSSLPPLGTGFSDGTRAGPQVLSGIYTGTPGAPISPLFVYDIVPQPAAINNIAPSAIVNAGTTLLVGSGLVNSGNSGTNTITVFPSNLQNIVMFDCNRAVQVVAAAGASAITLQFYGIDIYDNFVTKEIVTTGAGTFTSEWTMKGIFRIYVTAPTTAAISIGCADAFGLPYVAYSPNYLIPYFNGLVDNTTLPVLWGTSGALTANTLTAVANPNVTANSLIFTSTKTVAIAAGFIQAPSASIVPGVSFSIKSSNATETSTVNYEIVSPGPLVGTGTLALVVGVAQFTVYSPLILPVDSNGDRVQVIRLGVNTFGGTVGILSWTFNAVDPILGESFTVTSSNAADVSTVNWQILSAYGEYSGLNTMNNNLTVASTVVTANTLVFSNYNTATNAGFLAQGANTAGTSYVINTTSATDASLVTTILRNPAVVGQYILPDVTSPATITSGDPRGVYIPSSPSTGAARLTIWMYNRGTLNANATIGADPTDPLFFNNNANLYGVTAYSDSNH